MNIDAYSLEDSMTRPVEVHVTLQKK